MTTTSCNEYEDAEHFIYSRTWSRMGSTHKRRYSGREASLTLIHANEDCLVHIGADVARVLLEL